MKKLISIIGIVSIGCVFFLVMLRSNKSMSDSVTIGIVQTASHPALDAVKKGCIERLKDTFGDKLNLIEQNAEGSLNTAHAIATSLHRNNSVKAVVTIGTMATQAMINVEQEKPIVFAAVTDPKVLGIDNRANVCGVSDAINVAQQIDAMMKLVPTVKTIGVLFNPAEPNSVSAVDTIKNEAKRRNLNVETFGVNSEAEVAFVASSACKHVDALVLPPDNTVASTIGVITAAAKVAKKPVFAGDAMLLSHGVLACAGGVDYHLHGRDAGELVVTLVRDGKKPGDCKVFGERAPIVSINKDVAKDLGISIS